DAKIRIVPKMPSVPVQPIKKRRGCFGTRIRNSETSIWRRPAFTVGKMRTDANGKAGFISPLATKQVGAIRLSFKRMVSTKTYFPLPADSPPQWRRKSWLQVELSYCNR